MLKLGIISPPTRVAILKIWCRWGDWGMRDGQLKIAYL